MTTHKPADYALRVNRAIAEALGWTDIHEDSWYWEGYHGVILVEGLVGLSPEINEPCPLPDFCRSLDAVLPVVEHLIKSPYSLDVVIDWVNGRLEGNVFLCHNMDGSILENDYVGVEAIAAAICETILQSRGVVIEEVP